MTRRPESPLDKDGRGQAFREEIHGSRGRLANELECQETLEMMAGLCPPHESRSSDRARKKSRGLLDGITDVSELRQRFSFPEQNDKLLVGVRRAQGWIADCISWHWKLTQPEHDAQRDDALAKIREQDRMPEWRSLADGTEANLTRLRDFLHVEIARQRQLVQEHLLTLTARIFPSEGALGSGCPIPKRRLPPASPNVR